MLRSARTQEEARRRAMQGDGEGAARLLRVAVEELQRVSPDSPRAEELTAQAQELEEFQERMLASPEDPTLRKQMRYSSREKQQGRQRPPEAG